MPPDKHQPRQPLTRRILAWLAALDTALESTERAALSGGVLAMALMAVINVFARNVLGSSLSFAEEINQLLIILVTFAGIGFAARRGRHIRMTAIYDQLPDTARRWLMTVITAITGLLLLILGGYAWNYVIEVGEIGGVTPALGIPNWIVYFVAPLGLFVGGIQFLLAAVRNAVADEVWLSFSISERAAEDAADEEAHI